MTQTLYERIGGARTLESVVHDFYDRVLTDPVVAPAFVGVDMIALRRHMTLYLSEAFADPRGSPGWDLRVAHRHLRITDRMFDAVVGHLAEVLEGVAVDADLVDEVIHRLAALRVQVVTVPSAESLPPPTTGGA